jgi:DNA-binding NarL/FixJ family response regulator
MSVLLASTDLMFATRASDAARAAGGVCRMISSAQLAEALSPETRLVLLDLSLPGVDPAEVVARVREASPTAAVVAFGPHVHGGKLEAAREAGCQEVVSRGELSARLQAIVAHYLAGSKG